MNDKAAVAKAQVLLLVMQAFIAGKTIQYRVHPGHEWKDVTAPNWSVSGEYRIKPEPKEVWVNHYADGTNYSTKQAFDHKADADAFRATRTKIAGKAVLYREVLEGDKA